MERSKPKRCLSKKVPRVLMVCPPAPFLAFPNSAPHIGVASLLAYLRANGVYAGYVNWEAFLPHEIDVPEGYDYYAFTAVTAQYYFAKLLRDQVANRKLGKTIIGGAHASVTPESCLADGFDYVVTGYGETALLKITQGSLSGGIVRGRSLEDIDRVGELPWDELLSAGLEPSYGTKTAHLLTMRGCAYKCAYCCSPIMYGVDVRFRRIQQVLDEVAKLVSQHNVDAIQFMDACFTINRTRVNELCDGLQPFGVRWSCQTRVDLIDPDIVQIMADSGCDKISFGIETGAGSVYSILNKQTTVEQSALAIKIAHDAGIKVKAYLIGGLPNDSEATFEETREFVDRNSIDDWLYSTFIPFPGTPMWRHPESYGMRVLENDWRLYYPLGLNARGPVNIETDILPRDRIRELRDGTLNFLRRRIPNSRVELAISRFAAQQERVAPYYEGLNWEYIA